MNYKFSSLFFSPSRLYSNEGANIVVGRHGRIRRKAIKNYELLFSVVFYKSVEFQ